MFCKQCGNQVGDNSRFCPNCGAETGTAQGTDLQSNLYTAQQSSSHVLRNGVMAESFMQQLSSKEKSAAIAHLIISSVQIVIGLFLYWWVLILGIINLLVGFQRLKSSKEALDPRKVSIHTYKNRQTFVVILFIVNLLFNLIGGIGYCFDFNTYSFVKSNEEVLEEISNNSPNW